MGIRVNKRALLRQLDICKAGEKELYFHKRLLSGELPQSIGGGIGQSRLCMFYLHRAHIGEDTGKYLAGGDAQESTCGWNDAYLVNSQLLYYGRKD